MVRAIGLRRDFPSGGGSRPRPARRGPDASQRGELLAVRGRSGSGKTTLLNLLGGLDRPTSGSVIVDGREVSGASDRAQGELRRTTVAYVFQTFGLVPILTAAENVEMPLRLLSAEPAERDRRVHELLDLVGLAGRAGIGRTSSPAASSSGSPSLAPWPTDPSSSSPTSPRASSTSETGHRIMLLLRDVVIAPRT